MNTSTDSALLRAATSQRRDLPQPEPRSPPRGGAMNRHTIILVQPTAGKASRTFADFETVPLAMDGVCQMFEKRLKELNPSMRSITYDINDLYHYIDLLPDLSALVLAPGARQP